MTCRDDIVYFAKTYLGDGPDSELIFDALGYREVSWRRLGWCGLWILGVYRLCGLTDVHWMRGYSLPSVIKRVRPTKTPTMADFGVSQANWHHMLVTERAGDRVHLIAGNTGPHPGKVDVSECAIGQKGVVWYSIEGYLT
jgi:hypothetical protein